MRIHELEIRRFRGIKHLQWSCIPGGVVALIGPGDSGKTTVLDAMGILFHGYWTLTLSENDFYQHSTKKPISITATVVDPPRSLVEDRQYLSHLRGVDGTTGEIVDEPTDHLPALTIRFTMASDFEPSWEIVCDRHEEGVRISGEKRRAFGVRRIDAASVDLRWGTHSPLRSVTNTSADHLTEDVLRKAARKARRMAAKGLGGLGPTVDQVADAARLLRGADEDSHFSAQLDADLAAISRGSVSLHADDLPVGRAGLGTRRLVSVAVESLAQSGANVLLCDELEVGLEPHRTRHLVRYLTANGHQVLLTTHSPVVLRELSVEQLTLLRPGDIRGTVTALRFQTAEHQGPMRSFAEAFLAPRVAVCEGLTEVGFIREICAEMEAEDPRRLSVVEPVDAGGESRVIGAVLPFERLGFDTAVVCDNDTALDLTSLPATVARFQCDLGLSIEQQVLDNATSQGCLKAVAYGVAQHGEDLIRDHLRSAGITNPATLTALLGDDATAVPSNVASGVAKAAKAQKNAWFKTIAGGEFLARMAGNPDLVTQTDSLVEYVTGLREWCAPDAVSS